ncbi:hypothetical protein Poli38472_007686 [Pythium oligandrum]|uniref:1,3-beta-glucanosyltransferase n=1 Tax=Pythium oligandrum TaxID=41045 RepID=A0A8K1CRP0_PYTOL|nr:hypothetical protein Poli38472_007686 [Pythium oligandrum]|eukprot:TMW68014.1 hypothetical protein Poli38472_007686 [Pythium oligandrum]
MPVNTKWSTCERKLLLNGKSFFVRGVNYAPTPIGKPGRLDMLGHEEIFTRDLKNLRDMHANAVKTYDFYSNVDHTEFLDAAYNKGSQPIYTIFSIWIDQSLMEPMTPIESTEFQEMIENYYEMAKQTSGHPGVMGYSIGGEINSIVVVNEPTFWEKFTLLTKAVRKGMAENGNAQKVITTTFVDDGGASFTAGERFHADVDLWGSNVYQTNYPGSVIPAYKSVPTNKPMLVSEYGYPYASNVAEGGKEDLELVADMLTSSTVAMEKNFNLSDPLHEQIIVGGFVFEYSDEWWKSGNEDIHNYGGVKNNGFPLGYLSEEYFGLYRAARPDGHNGIDDMHPRPTVDMLTEIWGKGKLGGEGDDYTNCNALTGVVQLGKSASIRSNHGVVSSNPLGSVVEGMFAVVAMCALALLAFAVYDTRSRRSQYRRLSPAYQSGTSTLLNQSATTTSRRTRSIDEEEAAV